MSQEQNKTISGSVYDVYTEESQGYKENSMPRVGQTVEFEDGRKFVFVSTKENITQAATVMSSRPSYEYTSVAGTANAGSYKLVLNAPDIVANEYKDGTLTSHITGHTYKIKSNLATSEAVTMTLTLYDPIVDTAENGDSFYIRPSRTTEVVVGTAGSDAVGAAVARVNGSVDTGFCWLQYQGPGVAVTNGAGVNGDAVTVDAAGLVSSAALPTDKVIGQLIGDPGGTAGEIYWTIGGGC